MTSDPNRTGVQARFRARFRISFRIAGIGAAVLLVIAALVAGACGNPGGGSSEDEVSDDLVTGGTTIDDVESFAALITELGYDWSIPEIAIQREWASEAGSLLQIEQPEARFEVYRFEDRASLASALARMQSGAIVDLPEDAIGWSTGRVLIFLLANDEVEPVLNQLTAVLDEPVLVTGAVGVIVDAVGDDGEADASGSEEGAEPDAPDDDSAGGGDNPRPPEASTSSGNVAVRAGIGTYCWSGDNVAICGDSIGIITGHGVLEVESGSAFAFQSDLPWEELREAFVTASSRAETEELGSGSDWRAWAAVDGRPLPFTVENGLTVTADLEPGEYIVNLSFFFGGNDVQYGILLTVPAGTVSTPPSSDSGSDSGAEPDPNEEPDTPTTRDLAPLPPGDSSFVIGKPFFLEPGRTASLDEGGFGLVFQAVLGDSRCPLDVTCVWAGEVSVELRLTSAMSSSTFQLTLPGAPAYFTPPSEPTGEFEVVGLLLLPEPYSEVLIPASGYRLLLQVNRVGEDNGVARVETQAPIESVTVNVAESFPPQYFVAIESGLPNGCARFERIDVEREGATIRLTVLNTVPAPSAELACTLIYGIISNTVALGSDFEPGVEYLVVVNDQMSQTFVAQ